MNNRQLTAVLALIAATGLALAARRLAITHAADLGIPTGAAPVLTAGLAWAISAQLKNV
jgi:hypothetical protein